MEFVRKILRDMIDEKTFKIGDTKTFTANLVAAGKSYKGQRLRQKENEKHIIAKCQLIVYKREINAWKREWFGHNNEGFFELTLIWRECDTREINHWTFVSENHAKNMSSMREFIKCRYYNDAFFDVFSLKEVENLMT